MQIHVWLTWQGPYKIGNILFLDSISVETCDPVGSPVFSVSSRSPWLSQLSFLNEDNISFLCYTSLVSCLLYLGWLIDFVALAHLYSCFLGIICLCAERRIVLQGTPAVLSAASLRNLYLETSQDPCLGLILFCNHRKSNVLLIGRLLSFRHNQTLFMSASSSDISVVPIYTPR